jgi:hypothetical protein
MHDKGMGDGEEFQSPAAGERRDQAEALRHVLFIYPETMTLEELVCELTFGSDEFPERDRVERAVRDLIAAGLLRRLGDLVLPTRPAVNYHRIDLED